MRNLLALVIFCLVLPSQAAEFQSSYLKFSLPDKFDCKLNKKAYICRYRIARACQKDPKIEGCKKQEKRHKEAVIILAAKEVSGIDNIKAYGDSLRQPRSIQRPDGSTYQSKVLHNKKVKVNGLTWVDGMHLSSELPQYYTRYLATINGEVAVLVTFSAHKKYYTNYSSSFFKGIKSLAVTADRLAKVNPKELGPKVLSRPLDVPDELLSEGGIIDETGGSDNTSNLLFAMAILLAAIGVYIWLKTSKK